jgi:hypothetical protein
MQHSAIIAATSLPTGLLADAHVSLVIQVRGEIGEHHMPPVKLSARSKMARMSGAKAGLWSKAFSPAIPVDNPSSFGCAARNTP